MQLLDNLNKNDISHKNMWVSFLAFFFHLQAYQIEYSYKYCGVSGGRTFVRDLASVDSGFLGVTTSNVTLSCSQYLYNMIYQIERK